MECNHFPLCRGGMLPSKGFWRLKTTNAREPLVSVLLNWELMSRFEETGSAFLPVEQKMDFCFHLCLNYQAAFCFSFPGLTLIHIFWVDD